MCLASRKDFRDAVVAARSAFSGWSGKSAFNRSQILYRIAEMMESRRTQLIDELLLLGYKSVDANNEVSAANDRMVYYAGWCDKYQ
jgi:acyl-CoA reductase-like NAD-dependent aldehyde dehydrogenase